MFAGRENRDMDILIFKEVLDHMARVDRVLTRPAGSLLLAGRSGVGRRTAATIVAHMHQMQMFSPKVSRGYGLKQFKNDLKIVSILIYNSSSYSSVCFYIINRLFVNALFMFCFRT